MFYFKHEKGHAAVIMNTSSVINFRSPSNSTLYLYRFYEADTPVLLVGDPDMAREILIKQFDKFTERRVRNEFLSFLFF